MTGAEYRFLRIEMNLSQKTIGELFGVDAQTVARWEKGKNELPKMADVLIRAVYNEFIEQESKVRFLVDAINESEAQDVLNMEFEQNESGWHVAA
jgi:transcriptional regulator with XRE-family HTH domain